jgi:hypothetical protein
LLLLWSLLAWLLLNLLWRCTGLLLLLWGLLALLLRGLRRGLSVLLLQVLRRCLLPPLRLRLLLLPECVTACCCLCWYRFFSRWPMLLCVCAVSLGQARGLLLWLQGPAA